jgi:hypothetical protein
MLPKDEGGASCRAALLGIGVGEKRAFLGDPVYVWRVIAHDAKVIGADVMDTDVIASDDEDVRLLVSRLSRGDDADERRRADQQ